MDIIIRLETENDYRIVEELTREAFWNLYCPGCDEHYFAHQIRNSSGFIKELDFVAVKDDKIVGSIMYTKSYVLDEQNNKYETITIGPLSILPEFQNQGIGKELIEHTKKIAIEKGYGAIIIYGHPHNYCRRGFKGSKSFGITDSNGNFPSALLVLELYEGALSNVKGKFYETASFDIDAKDVCEFDKNFSPKEKFYTYTQTEFEIQSNSFLSKI